VVQEGDTLASIAKEKLGSEDQWQSIAEANNLDSPYQLQVGQTLIIPSADDMSSQGQSDFEESKPSEETQPMEEGTSEQSAPAPEQESPSQNY
ncbi:MAG TPA: LysM domain-containing protein, partial [Thermodesulfobacteriota bacterium]|nr:LysM domain-containing protein [Thermodesulfobacteriota bacterium]